MKRFKPVSTIFTGGAAALALMLSLAGCGEKRNASIENNPPVIQVNAENTVAKSHVAVEEVVGTVRPKLHSAIESKVSGLIEQMLAVPGQEVKRGDLLVQLDAREIQARLDQATAARDQAESDLGRYAKLISQHTITQQEFEATQSRARISRAAVIEAETMLGYTKIKAPFDGVITSKLADVGDLAAPGKPLLEIEDPLALRFEAHVPEAIIARIVSGAVLPVRIGGQPEISGTVTEISPAADSNSRTFLVKLDLPKTSGLRGGLFGRVTVPVGESFVLRVPATAVMQRGQMEIVFVVEKNHALLRLVRTGRRAGSEIEILSGVEAGEKVIIDGVGQLADGQRVEIKRHE